MSNTITSKHISAIPLVDNEQKERNKWQQGKARRKESLLYHQQRIQRQEKEQEQETLFFNNSSISPESASSRNAWETSLIPDLSSIIESEAIQQEEPPSSLTIINNSRYLSEEEIDLIRDTYLNDGKFKECTDSALKEILGAEEGSEFAVLNTILNKAQLSNAQIYMLLHYLINTLKAKQQRKQFLLQLQRELKLFEQQESGELFEFFSLLNNPEIKQLLTKHNISDIVQLAEIKQKQPEINSILSAIELVINKFRGQFDGMTSLYMRNRSQHLKMLSKHTLNREDKSILFETFRLEKYLMIINSLYLKQSGLYKNFSTEENVFDELIQTMGEPLIATAKFCISNFITEQAIVRLAEVWKLKKLKNFSYERFLHLLFGFIHSLPLDLFNNDKKQVQKVASGIYALRIDRDNTQDQEKNNKATTSLDIRKPKKCIINYI